VLFHFGEDEARGRRFLIPARPECAVPRRKSQIDQLGELVHPKNEPGRFLVLSYFDESGIHQGSEACVVAGYFGKRGPWRRLETGWIAALRDFDVPLSEFHAKDVLNAAGFFHGWKPDKIERLLNTLGEVVGLCRIHPICYGIFTKDFFSLSRSERRFLTGATWNAEKLQFQGTGNPEKPYFVAFNECLRIATSYTPAADRVHFLFGSDRPSSEYAVSLFRYLRKRSAAMRDAKIWFDSRCSPQKFGTIAFPLARETPGLQAADLFSHLSYKHMLERRHTGDWKTPPNALLLALLHNRKNPLDTSFRSAEMIREMISVVPGLPKD
jgi:hypothetical protein